MDRSPPPTVGDYPRCVDLGLESGRTEIAVVTVVFNAEDTVLRTVRSVQAQALAARHVVIDGGSTDATLTRLRQAIRPGDLLVSEPDRGISDAMNKGIAAANSRLVAILHADDWLSDGQLAAASTHLDAAGADFVFGDVDFYKSDRLAHRDRGDPDYVGKLDRRMPSVLHPSMLFTRAAFERVGLYRTDLKLAMDYEWLLRATRAGLRGAYSPTILANMNHDGASNTRYPATMAEIAEIAVRYGRPALQARAEQLARTAKIFAGRQAEHISPAAYLRLRRLINPQIVPAPR